MSHEEQLGELELFSLEKAEGRLHHSLKLPERRLQHEGCQSLVSDDR